MIHVALTNLLHEDFYEYATESEDLNVSDDYKILIAEYSEMRYWEDDLISLERGLSHRIDYLVLPDGLTLNDMIGRARRIFEVVLLLRKYGVSGVNTLRACDIMGRDMIAITHLLPEDMYVHEVTVSDVPGAGLLFTGRIHFAGRSQKWSVDCDSYANMKVCDALKAWFACTEGIRTACERLKDLEGKIVPLQSLTAALDDISAQAARECVVLEDGWNYTAYPEDYDDEVIFSNGDSKGVENPNMEGCNFFELHFTDNGPETDVDRYVTVNSFDYWF